MGNGDFAVGTARRPEFSHANLDKAPAAKPEDKPEEGHKFIVPSGKQGQLGNILKSAGLPVADAQIVARMNGLGNANRIDAGRQLYIPTKAEIAEARADIARNESYEATQIPKAEVKGTWEGLTPGGSTGGVS